MRTVLYYITLHYTSYLVYASYKETVHWRITESNIDDIHRVSKKKTSTHIIGYKLRNS